METGWTTAVSGGDGVAVAGGGGGDDDVRGHNSNFTNNAWDIYDISTTLTPTLAHYNYTTTTSYTTTSYTTTNVPAARVLHALLSTPTTTTTTTEAGVIRHRMPDPHMMCLKLGRRHYCDGSVVLDRGATAEPSSLTTARSSSYTAARVTSSTRCQVEGCNVALGGAKEYYRRHKVCENHSKAPVVVVLGMQQRFCQQCSRFHDVMEFDEAKRSCRRRLEGHNLRRRKGNFPNENNSMMKRRHVPLSAILPQSQSESRSKPVCALSLLSSPKSEPWISSGDMSSRCSAALYELIVANRETSVSGHFLDHNSSHEPVRDNTMHTSHDTEVLNRFDDHTTMSLDLKQAPDLDFGLWSMKEKSKDPEEWNDYCWSSFGGTNVV